MLFQQLHSRQPFVSLIPTKTVLEQLLKDLCNHLFIHSFKHCKGLQSSCESVSTHDVQSVIKSIICLFIQPNFCVQRSIRDSLKDIKKDKKEMGLALKDPTI